MATPLHRNPCTGVMKFKILVEPPLVIITTHLVCMDHAQGREIHQFYTFNFEQH